MSTADKNPLFAAPSLSDNIKQYQQSVHNTTSQTKNSAALGDHEEDSKNTQVIPPVTEVIERRPEVKPLTKILLKPLAPLAPKKQILPKLLPAQAKHNVKNSVNTSKQWVLPPRPRPGRKSTEHTPTPVSNLASPMLTESPPLTSNSQASPPPPVIVNKKKTKVRKTVKPKKTSLANPVVRDEHADFELKLQLQSATEENENLRKIINKLNREIDLLKLVKLENKSRSSGVQLPSVPENSNNNADIMISDLSTTIDPVKINYNLKSKRLKRFSSESGFNSGIGLNGNSLDDAGFYNADSLMPSDLLLSSTVKSGGSSLETLVNEKNNLNNNKNSNNNNVIKGQMIKPVKLERSRTTPVKSSILNNLDLTNTANSLKNELCGFCSNGSPCVCYESTLDLLQTRDLPMNLLKANNYNNNNFVKLEESQSSIPLPTASASASAPVPVNSFKNPQSSRFSRTTDIIGDLGKNFIKNEMDVDMSFFVKPDEQDTDDFMMM